jgi:hypothetical protein
MGHREADRDRDRRSGAPSRTLARGGGAACLLLALGLAGVRAADAETAASAARFFREFEELCEADGGRLWGRSLCGPLLLVDPATRDAVANRPDAEGRLRAGLGVFTGTLPDDVGVANTSAEWGGTRWTMILRGSLGGDPLARASLMAHEAFHRIQPDLGLAAASDLNVHLDTPKGRFWIQVEWNALERALLAGGAERKEAISDALTFRNVRRHGFAEAARRENALEIFEGLAEYTGMRLAGYSPRQVVDAVRAKRNDGSGFVRSFAYVSGPLYGFLLDEAGVDWRPSLTPDTDLGALLARALDVSAGSITAASEQATAYGGNALRAAESERGLEQMKQLARWRKDLVEGRVLQLDLAVVTSGSFDPNKVFPFAEGLTVYTTRELIAEWGVLKVSGGAILENGTKQQAHVSLDDAAADFSSGPGWWLKLDPAWSVEPGERDGDFVVRRKPES